MTEQKDTMEQKDALMFMHILEQAEEQYLYIEDDMNNSLKYEFDMENYDPTTCDYKITAIDEQKNGIETSIVPLGTYQENLEEFAWIGTQDIIRNKVLMELVNGGTSQTDINALKPIFEPCVSIKKELHHLIPKFCAIFMPAYHLVLFKNEEHGMFLYHLIRLPERSSLPDDIFEKLPILNL